MYIRTKDGVYEVKVNKYHELVYCKNNQIVLSCNIIKQSKNLEELCDEFVKVWCNGKVNPEVLVYDEQYEEEKENILLVYPKGNIAIYGAVWVDGKGLIYVAKIDNEGKLELI